MDPIFSARMQTEKRKNGILYASVALLCAFSVLLTALRMRYPDHWGHASPEIELGILAFLTLKYAVDITDNALTRERGILITALTAGAMLLIAGFLSSGAVGLALTVGAVGILVAGMFAAHLYTGR
ncbi:MAG TPA: hypothetical protein VGV16_05695 [Gammaproteobacteria bacterium]|nr:hypothetical protein [Gammaproteobacteria bacterium]